MTAKEQFESEVIKLMNVRCGSTEVLLYKFSYVCFWLIYEFISCQMKSELLQVRAKFASPLMIAYLFFLVGRVSHQAKFS